MKPTSDILTKKHKYVFFPKLASQLHKFCYCQHENIRVPMLCHGVNIQPIWIYQRYADRHRSNIYASMKKYKKQLQMEQKRDRERKGCLNTHKVRQESIGRLTSIQGEIPKDLSLRTYGSSSWEERKLSNSCSSSVIIIIIIILIITKIKVAIITVTL